MLQYAQKRPLLYDKTNEEKISLHSKEVKKKYRGDIKIRHRKADNTSGDSSENSNTSEFLSSQKPAKPQASTNRSQKSSATPNTSTVSSTASSTNSKMKRNRRAPDYYGFENSVCSVSDQESVPAPKHPEPSNPVIERAIQEEAIQPPSIETSFQLPIVSPPDPRIKHIGATPPF